MDYNQFKLTNKEVVAATKQRPCVHCGACCRSFSIDLQNKDVIREPALLNYATEWKLIPDERRNKFTKAPWVILTKSDCLFLNKQSKCNIYKTRPDTCRRFATTYLTCHSSRLEERGLDIGGFIYSTVLPYNVPPQMSAGIIFSIDPAKIKPIGLARGMNVQSVELEQIIDINYLNEFRKKLK